MRIASTDANIGRSMNTEEMFMGSLPLVGGRSLVRGPSLVRSRSLVRAFRRCLVLSDARVALHRHFLRIHDNAGMHALRAVYDDHVAGLEPRPYDTQAIDHATQLHTPVLDLVIRANNSTYFWL